MTENSIQGFQTDAGVKHYDYNALANKPDLITQNEIDVAISTANKYTDEQIAKIDVNPVVQIEFDTTLTIAGKAADAKAVGDALKEKLDNTELNSAIDIALAKAKENGEFDGESGVKGDKGDKGDKGEQGEPGNTPYIGVNNNWFIGEVDTGKPSYGVGIASIFIEEI